jgi:deoxyhypusine synthase
MPVTHVVDHERREMNTTADGPITMDDIRKHLTKEHRDKGLAYRELIEASRATAAFSASDVRTTVEILRAYGQKGVLGPTAIVVGNDLAYGMMRMLAIMLEDICALQPFRTRQEAEQWLANASASPSMSGSEGAA